MNELIHIHNQGPELRADSREIAKVFGVAHQHLRESIEKNHAFIEQLGIIQFETGKLLEGAGRPEKFAWLNFDQIALLLTLSKTTEENKELRLKLIIEFRDARNRLRPIDRVLLSIPSAWRKVFQDDFYKALLKLYDAEYNEAVNKPQWVGVWTLKFIYRPLYEQLPEELRKRRQLHAFEMGTNEWRKLHQFIEEHAKEKLKTHLVKVTALLESSRGRQDFYERFASMFYGRTQLILGEPDISADYATEKGQFFDTLKKAARTTAG